MKCIGLVVLLIGLQLVLASDDLDDDSDFSDSSEEGDLIWYTYAESEPSNKKCIYYRISDDYTVFEHFLTDVKTNEVSHLKGKIQSRKDGRITDMMYTEPKAYTLEYTIVFVNDDFEISYYTDNQKNFYYIYTKERSPSEGMETEINQRLEENNISRAIFNLVEQEDCPDVL